MQTKILVADDEPIIQTLIRRALAGESYQFINVDSGIDALQAARREKPNLILLDLGLPGKDGHQVLRELRGDIETQMIPVIILTGQGETEEKVRGLKDGADDYMTKPFAVAELKARIAGILHRHAQELSANPLTHLPGSPTIEEHVVRLLAQGANFAFFHIDIDNFKAFNDAHGYAEGDRALRETAKLLVTAVKERGDCGDFIGHIGGDDFVLVSRPEDARDLALEIMERFDQLRQSFYGIEERAKGYVVTVSRRGQPQRSPLMTLSISITRRHDDRRFGHYAEMVDAVTEIKAYLKSRTDFSKSAFLIDRRG